MEARIITDVQAKLIATYEKAAAGGADASVERKALEAVMPPRKAETRAQKATDPSWNEVMAVAIPDKDISDGAILRYVGVFL